MSEATAVADRPQQQVTIEEVGPARKKLVITVPESRIQETIEQSYSSVGTDAAIPGFRKGHAPRRLVERRFGESIRSDVKGRLISEAYTQAVEDEGLDVLGQPEIEGVEELELPESGDFVITAEVEVTPEVELPPYNELKVEKKVEPVTDEDVTAELEKFRERQGRMLPVDDAQAEPGDFLMGRLRLMAGEVTAEQANDTEGPEVQPLREQNPGYVLVNGEDKEFKGHVLGILIPDLGKQAAGKKAGDTIAIPMTGPSGHEDEKIKDQPITVVVNIDNIQRLQPASMEETLEAAQAETEDELRERVKGFLEQRRQQEAQAGAHTQVRDQLAERVELALPEGLTGRQTDRVLRRREMELLYEGKTLEEAQQEVAEMRSGSEEEARKQLKMFFILDKAAKDLEIEVSQNELNGRIAMLAAQQNRRPEKLRQDMQQRGELEQLYLQLREQKTLDAILEKAEVTGNAPAETETETEQTEA